MALFETVLPWAFVVLRKRWEQAQEEEGGSGREGTSSADVNSAEPEIMSHDGETLPSRQALASGEGGGTNLAASGRGGRDSTEAAASGRGGRDSTEAQRLWDEARKITHQFKPDWEKDRDYLAKVYGAAKRGHLEAMAKLGEYAYRRGAVVEAYYWTALAELEGAKGLDAALREMKKRWLLEGCPAEHGNAYDGFSEMQGSFARVLLRIRSAVNAPLARARMQELADLGCEEARLFLRRGNK